MGFSGSQWAVPNFEAQILAAAWFTSLRFSPSLCLFSLQAPQEGATPHVPPSNSYRNGSQAHVGMQVSLLCGCPPCGWTSHLVRPVPGVASKVLCLVAVAPWFLSDPLVNTGGAWGCVLSRGTGSGRLSKRDHCSWRCCFQPDMGKSSVFWGFFWFFVFFSWDSKQHFSPSWR